MLPSRSLRCLTWIEKIEKCAGLLSTCLPAYVLMNLNSFFSLLISKISFTKQIVQRQTQFLGGNATLRDLFAYEALNMHESRIAFQNLFLVSLKASLFFTFLFFHGQQSLAVPSQFYRLHLLVYQQHFATSLHKFLLNQFKFQNIIWIELARIHLGIHQFTSCWCHFIDLSSLLNYEHSRFVQSWRKYFQQI